MTFVIESHADADLLRRVAERDSSAVGALYDRHARVLLGLICRILRDRAEAEDVLQEVFVRVWERASTYNVALGSPGAWLTRIARNRAIDRLRARAVRPDLAEAVPPAERLAPDREANPESRARASEAQRAVLRALSSLSPDQRRLIEDAYYLGYSQSELASRFQLPLGTVKTRIRAGMMTLKAQLQQNLAASASEDRAQP